MERNINLPMPIEETRRAFARDMAHHPAEPGIVTTAMMPEVVGQFK